MGKRKRGAPEERQAPPVNGRAKALRSTIQNGAMGADDSVTIQIVAGSYERVLHGITAEILRLDAPAEGQKEGNADTKFSDTFLFHAHTSAIRCLALSPPSTDSSTQNQKVLLATGSSDGRINLYHLSASAPPRTCKASSMPSLAGNAVVENPKNRELGSLVHHSGSVTALHFPTRSKLLSSAEDSTIAVARSRDWTVLSTIKAPIPKALGRPSGDTAPPGGVPAGVSDFAVHPSMKLMLSVGRGEKCMRLWNLVTGKKAGVLNFGREILQGVGEGKWGSGEGRRVLWNQSGEEFVVGFERGAVVFGLNSKPKGRISPSPPTKIHQLRYLGLPQKTETLISNKDETPNVLAVSTEDGRVLFYSTALPETPEEGVDESGVGIPNCRCLGQLGGRNVGSGSRIKDFDILEVPTKDLHSGDIGFVTVTGSSDGIIRLWRINTDEILHPSKASNSSADEKQSSVAGADSTNATNSNSSPCQIGTLVGTYETGNRITCLKAFVMVGNANASSNIDSDSKHLDLEMDSENSSSSDSGDDDN
ncbi:MAG: hypothetical protein M1839_000420 [Geoglossum umbratile]|nr:MAG: hypothetical protein M1839_000420 [Geoglossum umbratile]